jgi:hypothetical protein
LEDDQPVVCVDLHRAMSIEPGAMCIEPGAVSIEPARMSKRFAFGNRYWKKESRKENLQDDDEEKLLLM